MNDVHYPIGRFQPLSKPMNPTERQQMIEQFEAIPANLEKAVAGLTPEQLDSPARAGGWTVRQLAHHIADSHLNGYVRMKWALTEDSPVIKPYDQDRWSELKDVQQTPIGVSMALLTSLHARWAVLMKSMTDDDFKKTLQHPETGVMNLENLLALFVWHGSHHTSQILGMRDS